MQILLANAKIMFDKADRKPISVPLFQSVATVLAEEMQAVWAKSCRGAMVRFIMNNQVATPEELAAFSYEGFEYAPELGEVAFPHFVR